VPGTASTKAAAWRQVALRAWIHAGVLHLWLETSLIVNLVRCLDKTACSAFPGQDFNIRKRSGVVIKEQHRAKAFREIGVGGQVLPRCIFRRDADTLD
jgi:hypothetical protein